MSPVPWEYLFKIGASAAGTEFCEWVQVGTDVYILYRKYQVRPHSVVRFSAACAAAIAHRNLFFSLYQQNKSSTSKLKFRQASNCCYSKGFLKLPNLLKLIKQKRQSLPRNLALTNFGTFLIVLSAKKNLLYLLYLTFLRSCILLLIK